MAELMHYVLFRFKEGALTQNKKDDFESTFAALKDNLSDDILDHSVSFNCIERDTNMDVMVTLHLAGEQSLEKYIKHPLHTEFAHRTDPLLESRCSFDCRLL